jgi:hypothetical protein
MPWPYCPMASPILYDCPCVAYLTACQVTMKRKRVGQPPNDTHAIRRSTLTAFPRA